MLKFQNVTDIKGVLLQWFISFLIKKNAGVAVKNENMLNKQLSEEWHKPIIRIFF